MKKNVLITGATGGIGKAICKLLQKKYDLIAVGRDIKKLENLEKEEICVKKKYICDLSKPEEIKSLVDNLIKQSIQIDILVNNAGITDDSLFIRMTPDKWENVIKTNLNSNFLLTNLISRYMIKKKWGRIVNITSVVGHTGNIGQSNYSASKAAIVSMSKSIAIELAKRNITVNCISPGFIQTNMTEILTNEQKQNIFQQLLVSIYN